MLESQAWHVENPYLGLSGEFHIAAVKIGNLEGSLATQVQGLREMSGDQLEKNVDLIFGVESRSWPYDCCDSCRPHLLHGGC